jgi:hypothetical protein
VHGTDTTAFPAPAGNAPRAPHRAAGLGPTGKHPETIVTNTANYSDIVFGLLTFGEVHVGATAR